MLFLENLLLISSKGRIFMQVIIYLPTGQSVGLINESHFAYLTYRVVTGAWFLRSWWQQKQQSSVSAFISRYHIIFPPLVILSWQKNESSIFASYRLYCTKFPASVSFLNIPTNEINLFQKRLFWEWLTAVEN